MIDEHSDEAIAKLCGVSVNYVRFCAQYEVPTVRPGEYSQYDLAKGFQAPVQTIRGWCQGQLKSHCDGIGIYWVSRESLIKFCKSFAMTFIGLKVE